MLACASELRLAAVLVLGVLVLVLGVQSTCARPADGAAVGAADGAQAGPKERARGTWISSEEMLALPMEGPAWRALAQAAAKPVTAPCLGERDSNDDVLCLAKALVAVRKDDAGLRQEVHAVIRAVVGSERKGDGLALGRNLPGYVIAAELVGLPPDLERSFREWLAGLLDLELAGTTLRKIHERRPNNWGTHAGGARAVIARYLGDEKELARVAQLFRAWTGERGVYDGYEFGALDWQADALHPVGINPRGAQRDGHSLDGVLPDDQRRSGGFSWPPPKENYVYEALQGALLQAIVLHRAGYDAFEWGDRALLRAALWLQNEASFPAEGDDAWQPHVINHYYGAELPAPCPAKPGKNVGWTDWTLAPVR
jgi:alginate lyase